MVFDLEFQMVKPAEQWLASQDMDIKREFFTPWGICDLVGCTYDEEKVSKRISLGQTSPIGPQLRVILLSKIPDVEENDSISFTSLYREFANFFAEEKIKQELQRLIRNKFVVESQDGNLQRINGWLPIHTRLVALELKLNRINDVLHQATCNLEFADESYVGLPLARAKSVMDSEKKKEFQKKGIGIVGIDQNSCNLLLKADPVKSERNLVLQMHCLERFWRTRFRGK